MTHTRLSLETGKHALLGLVFETNTIQPLAKLLEESQASSQARSTYGYVFLEGTIFVVFLLCRPKEPTGSVGGGGSPA